MTLETLITLLTIENNIFNIGLVRDVVEQIASNAKPTMVVTAGERA